MYRAYILVAICSCLVVTGCTVTRFGPQDVQCRVSGEYVHARLATISNETEITGVVELSRVGKHGSALSGFGILTTPSDVEELTGVSFFPGMNSENAQLLIFQSKPAFENQPELAAFPAGVKIPLKIISKTDGTMSVIFGDFTTTVRTNSFKRESYVMLLCAGLDLTVRDLLIKERRHLYAPPNHSLQGRRP